ncbi:hypothetical protein DIPPA_11813 [Diplonema papillatum]|nr:hypothetical protein DIPPA_11813 [Diplonema papillatum]
MEMLGAAGAVAEAEELIAQAPHVPSLGNKLCPYLIEHYEAAYRNAGLSHERTVARMRSVITDA